MGCCFMEPSLGGDRYAENATANYIAPIRGSAVNVHAHMDMKSIRATLVCRLCFARKKEFDANSVAR